MDEASVGSKFDELRHRAEELLGKAGEDRHDRFPEMDFLSLIHELEVHQIELQLQNEELRLARRELEESRKAYADLYEQAPIGYVTVGKEGIISASNRSASEMLQTSKDELTGRGFSNFILSDDHNAYFDLIREVAESKRKKRAGEIRLLRARTVPFYARVEVAPSRDGNGQLNGWRIVFGDISDLKHAEEELTSYAKRLERSNSELQDFAFTASHDLQEPLRKIQAFGDMLKKKCSYSLGREGADYVERMSDAAKRLQKMVNALLDYSRIVTKATHSTSVDLGRIVQEVLLDLDWQIKKNGAAVTVEDLPAVEADPNQMRQLFQNLISNALKFRGEKPCLINIHSRPAEGAKREAGHWEIFVEDNGIGFDQKNAERIFALFQRLHGRSAYEGTGMGLAICRRIVEHHQGTITALGSPGKGATFVITLPARQKNSL